jgi:hypothetical protein
VEPKASGKDIILAILDNMDESCEPLLYRTLAPSHYDVYPHFDHYNRLSSVFSRTRDEIVLALDKKLAGLNRKGRSLLPGLKPSKSVYEAAEKSWSTTGIFICLSMSGCSFGWRQLWKNASAHQERPAGQRL